MKGAPANTNPISKQNSLPPRNPQPVLIAQQSAAVDIKNVPQVEGRQQASEKMSQISRDGTPPKNKNIINYRQNSTEQKQTNLPQTDESSKLKKKLITNINKDRELNRGKREISPNSVCTRDENLNFEEMLRVK